MKHYTLDSVARVVESETGIRLAAFLGHDTERGLEARRTAEMVRARRLLVLMLRKFTRLSFPEIAAATTGRTHATWVEMHATAERAIQPDSPTIDPKLRAMVARATHRLVTTTKETTSGEEAGLQAVPGCQLPEDPQPPGPHHGYREESRRLVRRA